MKKTIVRIAVLTLAFALPFFVSLSVSAADKVVHSSLNGNEALATFNTFNECEDNVVGVTVLQNTLKDDPGGTKEISEVSVFGNFENICEGGAPLSFFGTVPLKLGEFTQNKLKGATLNKKFVIDGYEIHLALRWAGEGKALVYESKIKEDGPPERRGSEHISMRSANVKGTFVVNGLDHAAHASNKNGNLHLIRNKTTTMYK